MGSSYSNRQFQEASDVVIYISAGRVGEGCFRVGRAIYRLAKVGGGREVEDLGKEKLVDEIRIQRKGMDGARD